MNEKKILFVDDEQFILDGLSNLLRKQRKRWQMTFALGAEAALIELGKTGFDVVVTDMRMPHMDGAKLLRLVKERQPAAARIILSGQAEREATIASLGVAHQFLSKPCSGEALTAVIERTCGLQLSLQNEQIRAVIGKLDKLPSPPTTYFELLKAAADPNTGIADLARIVARDAAMSIKVLQLVNSAFFGLAQPVSSIGKAAGYLGSDLLKGLALNAHVFAELHASGRSRVVLERVQTLSLVAGKLAALFMPDKKLAEEAQTAALIHDAGMLVLCQALPAEFDEIVEVVERTGVPFHVEEQRRLGVTHAEVGAYLLGVWGLPFAIVEAVAYHHCPSQVSAGPREILAAVHVASALLDPLERAPGAEPVCDVDHAFLAHAGLSERFAEWHPRASRELADAQQKEAA
jgi:HD-like signal output (HDOD) protein